MLRRCGFLNRDLRSGRPVRQVKIGGTLEETEIEVCRTSVKWTVHAQPSGFLLGIAIIGDPRDASSPVAINRVN